MSSRLSATDEGGKLVLVQAVWTCNGESRSRAVTADGAQAQVLANEWANQLAVGREPAA